MKAKARLVAILSRSGRLRPALLGACAAAFLLMPASQALANGTLEVDVDGSGAGAVTSTAQVFVGANPVAPAGAAPGQIDCDETGGPICEATFSGVTTFTNVRATLTATPDPGSYLAGWQQSGATSVTSGCTTPPGEPGTCVLNLNGNPGPTAEATATFDLIPDPPPTVTGATAPGAGFALTTLQGTVDPEGAEVAECYFEYGTTTEYGTKAPCEQSAAEIGEESDPVPVSASTEPLEPLTTYHYRLVASNLGGASTGADRSFATGPAPVGSCPNEALRLAQGIAALLLPDCMALEQVSPVQKAGQPAREPMVAVDGERVVFRSAAPLGGNPGVLDITGDLYVATRGAGGWVTASTAPPAGTVGGWSRYGGARSFTPDLSRWLQVAGTLGEVQFGKAQAFGQGLDGLFVLLGYLPEARNLGSEPTRIVYGGKFEGSSADHSHVHFSAGHNGSGEWGSYLGGDPTAAISSIGYPNAYVAHRDSQGAPTLELLARDRFGKVWGGTCGGKLGGPRGTEPQSIAGRNQGALSEDGTRALFSTRPSRVEGECATSDKLRILERLEGQAGPWIGPLYGSECDRTAPVCSTVDGDDFYEGASLDQSKVFFTTNRQLADSDTDSGATSCTEVVLTATSCDLYLYDGELPLGQRLIQVSEGESGTPTPGEGAEVLKGVTGISSDGSHVYFVAKGVLTPATEPSPKGLQPVAGQPNLYAYVRDAANPDGRTTFIGTLDAATDITGAIINSNGSKGLWGNDGTFQNQAYPVPALDEDGVGGDGHILVFQSGAALTADDSDGTRQDVFRYDTDSGALTRISKGLPGGSDDGPFDVDPRYLQKREVSGTDFAVQERWVSEDGSAILFKTEEGLVPGDANEAIDSYMRIGERLVRLPGTADPNRKLRDIPVLSPDGSEVAFTTFAPLLGRDGDGARDVYAARVNGGFAEPEPATECEPISGCRGSRPAAPGAAIAPSTASRTGNPSPRPRRCGAAGRKAQKLSLRAKRLGRHARQTNNPRRAKRARGKSRRLARQARKFSQSARKCRRANRRAGR